MLTTRHTLKMPVAATGAVDAAGSLPTGTRVTMIVLLVLTMVRTAPAVNSEHREDIQFQITHQKAGPDVSVFVLGSLPELGGGDLTMAVKLIAGEDLL